MANKKISQLTSGSTPLSGTEIVPVVQGSDTVKVTTQDIANLGSSGPLPVETTYPVTTPASAGTRFWYKGNEWYYMTQDEIDSAGWTGLVNVGFPAPVVKNLNIDILYEPVNINTFFGVNATVIDFLGLGYPSKMKVAFASTTYSAGISISEIRNANLLKSLEDVGTIPALVLASLGLSDTMINQVFTQLPSTTKTATINVINNPGSATCNPTIATNKGYTVITS